MTTRSPSRPNASGPAGERAALYRRRRDLRSRTAPLPQRHPDHLPSRRRGDPADLFPGVNHAPPRPARDEADLHRAGLGDGVRGPDGSALRRGPDQPGVSPADQSLRTGDGLPRRIRQPGRSLQHPDAVPGPGHPGDLDRADPPDRSRPVAAVERGVRARARIIPDGLDDRVPPAQPAGQGWPGARRDSSADCRGARDRSRRWPIN